MKTKSILLSTTLMIALAMPAVAQHEHNEQSKAKTKGHGMSSIMGEPKFDKSVNGVNMKVWLITQDEHKKMMKEMGHGMMGMSHGKESGRMEHNMMSEGMKHDTKGMDEETMEAMMAGTHHIMLVATDTTTKKPIDDASAKIVISSPSKKTSSVELKRMKDHFGAGLTLDEKGTYILNLRIEAAKKIHSADFQYLVR